MIGIFFRTKSADKSRLMAGEERFAANKSAEHTRGSLNYNNE